MTLHHLMENVDLRHAGIRFHAATALRVLATRATIDGQLDFCAVPAYRRTLMEKYNGDNVHFRAHGILSARPEPPDV